MNAAHHRRPHRSLLPACLLFAAISVLISAPAEALRIPEEHGPSRTVRVYTFWNPDYLYLAARVPDTMLTGTATDPMSAADQDDAIEFDLGTAKGSYRLVISAAGGMTMFSRDAGGSWRTDDAWVRGPRTIKYAVNAIGTLNNPRDVDTEFDVECGIPWDFLGGVPRETPEDAFNVVVWMQGENEGLVSWAPGITSPSDVGDISRWGQLVFATSSALTTAQGSIAIAPLQLLTPFIDGVLNADEWMTAGTLSFEKPAPSLQPGPAAPGAAKKPVLTSVFGIYRYDWDNSRFWRPDGTPATVDQPRDAPGPWYGWQHVDWHRAQLDEVRRAGIDTLLVHYRGDPESRRTWACAGLDRLTQALKEMRAEGKSYPLLGLYLDTEPLQGVDLKSTAGKQLLYGMIRDFFLHVPPEFRAQVGAKPATGVPGGVPVLLGEPTGLADWDGGFQKFVAQHLQRDFGGGVVWLGSRAWKAKGATGFYATFRLSTEGLVQSSPDGASAYVISPGYCPPPGASGEPRARRGSRAYRTDWQRILAAAPDLVVIDSWNDYADGTDIAPSRQYGFEYDDTTRYFQARLGANQPRALRLVKYSVPRLLQPGREYTVELIIENDSTEDVITSTTVTADTRITRRSDGKVVLTRTSALGLKLLAGQIARVPVVISTKDALGQPLPSGDYLFSLVVMKSRVPYLRSKLVAHEEAELTVPITLGQPPAQRATIISTSLPSSMEAGATEQVVVRLRNDGAESWRVKDTQLSYHWVRFATNPQTDTREARQVVAEGERAQLPKDVAPGEVVSVMIPVKATGADGTPLAVPKDSDGWSYRVQWNLVQGAAGWFPPDGPPAEEAIQVVKRESPALWQSASVPKTVEAGSTFPVTVVVANAGTRPWRAAATAVEATWYRWDGEGGVRLGSPAHPSADVAPGETLSLEVKAKAPDMAGQYWLVWSVNSGDGPPGVSGLRRDTWATPVSVHSAELHTVDLSSLTNVVVAATDSDRSRGDMDGSGRCFPAECLPPDQSGSAGLYPSGYYASESRRQTGTGAIPFTFPDGSSGMSGAVACDGQSIALGGPGAAHIYLLAASTSGAQQIEVTLKHADGSTEQVPLSVPSWTERAAALKPAFCSPFLRAPDGDLASTPGYLYELAITPKSGAAVSLQLPKNLAVKIVAITVEGEPAAAAPAK